MKPTVITKTCKLPDGREITIETGKLARPADGSVVLRMGNTMILATVVSSLEAKPGTDFISPGLVASMAAALQKDRRS